MGIGKFMFAALEAGVTEKKLKLSERILAKVGGAHRAWAFSDGSQCWLVIYRNFFRPHNDFVCKFIIYDSDGFIRASVPAKVGDDPFSLTQFRMYQKSKENKKTTPIGVIGSRVGVRRIKVDPKKAVAAKIMGFNELVGYSDRSFGGNVEYRNQIMPAGYNSVNMGFVLDGSLAEIARYVRGNHRLVSAKEYEFIINRKDAAKRADTDKSANAVVGRPWLQPIMPIRSDAKKETRPKDDFSKRYRDAEIYRDYVGGELIRRARVMPTK